MTVLAALVVAATVIGLYAWHHLTGVVRRRRHAPVVVTLKSGTGFKGVLVADDARALVLGSVEMVTDSGKPTSVDGEVIVPWVDVTYLQRL